MILLFGALTDASIGYLVTRLLEQQARFVLLDPRRHLHGYELSWTSAGGVTDGHLRYGDEIIPLADIRSAYVQSLRAPRLTGVPDSISEQAECLAEESFWLLHTFVETAPILAVNRPSASATNASKPYQQQRIAAAGFRVPRTLVTNCPEEARHFYESCRQRVIYKSLSYRRSIVVRLTEADLGRLEQVRACPTQFQEWVPGTDIRVHVVGRRLFATEITTEAVDYRYAGRSGHPRRMRGIELPPEIAQRCYELAARLGLVSTGIDLRRTPDEQYYCFEANPTPGFAFYQQYTGQRIGEALADALIRGAA